MKAVLLYYWLTPLFWLLDEVAGANVRTAALEGHPWWKALYYLACMAIVVGSHYHPAWTARLGMVETSTNILLLVMGVFVPYYRFVDSVAEGELPSEPTITMETMTNFILSAAVLILSLAIYRASRDRR